MGFFDFLKSKGVTGGAGTGAALGSVVPGVGNAVGAGLGALVGGIGSLFHHKANSAHDRAAYDANKPLMQHGLDVTGARSSLARAIAKAYGIDTAFDGASGSGMLDKLSTPLAAPAYNDKGNTWGMLGDAATGIGGALTSASGPSFEEFMQMLQDQQPGGRPKYVGGGGGSGGM